MTTLLETAKRLPLRAYLRRQIGAEDIDLAFAWIRGEITSGQLQQAYTGKRSSANKLYRVALALREGYRLGTIVIKKKGSV